MAKILLVEDDELVRYSLNRVLTNAGYEVVEAEDGVAGLRKFKTTKPDLVLTDIVMPEQDGLGLLNQLRAMDKTVPILVMSGGGERLGMDYLLLADKFGASAIIAKPFDNAVLLTKINGLLKKA